MTSRVSRIPSALGRTLLLCLALPLSGCGYVSALKFNNQGVKAMENRQLWDSISEYNRALEKVNDNSRAYSNRALSLYLVGNYSQSLRDYNRAIDLDPRYRLPYNNRGVLFHFLGEDERALLDYNFSTLVDPDYPEPYFNRALLYYSWENYPLALTNVEIAILKHRDSDDDQEGYTQEERDRVGQMSEDELAQKTVRSDKDWAEAVYLRGMIQEQLGNMAQARLDYAHARELLNTDEKKITETLSTVRPQLFNYRRGIIE